MNAWSIAFEECRAAKRGVCILTPDRGQIRVAAGLFWDLGQTDPWVPFPPEGSDAAWAQVRARMA